MSRELTCFVIKQKLGETVTVDGATNKLLRLKALAQQETGDQLYDREANEWKLWAVDEWLISKMPKPELLDLIGLDDELRTYVGNVMTPFHVEEFCQY